MNSRVARILSAATDSGRSLGAGGRSRHSAFVAVVLVPGLELASEVAESSTALKLLGEQQRHPTLIRAALESMHDRLGDPRLHPRVPRRAAQLERQTRCRPARDDRAASGELVRPDGRHRRDRCADCRQALRPCCSTAGPREQVALSPVLEYRGVPYQDNESTGTQPQRERPCDWSATSTRPCAPAVIRCRCSTLNSRPSPPNCRRPICDRRPSCGWSC